MIELLGNIALWLLAIALIGYAALSWIAGEAARSKGVRLENGWAGATGVIGLILVALLLAGCASGAAVETRVQRELVPIATRPIKAEQVPPPVAPLPPRPDSLSAAADVLLGQWCKAVGYMLQADALLRLSAGLAAAELQRYPECEGGK